MIGRIFPILQPAVLVLPAGLTLMVCRAAARSARRLHCARLRDELVDAARAGEISIADQRVFVLIDWFDQVANTGRRPAAGRHAGKAPVPVSPVPVSPVPVSSVAVSLAAVIGPGSPLGPGGPFWPYRPEPGEAGGSDVYERALSLRRRLTRHRRLTRRHEPVRRSRPHVTPMIGRPVPKIIDLNVVTGHAKPKGALVPFTGELPLIERIFAVANQPQG